MLSESSTQVVISAFTQLGMSYEHARVYIALLHTGRSTASQIAKKSGVARTTTYDILETLQDWGFATLTKESNVTYFSPSDPEALFEKVEIHKNHTLNTYHTLEKNMYELEMLFAQSEPNIPKVRFYQGDNGLKTTLYDSLQTEELLTIVAGDKRKQTGIKDEPDYLLDFMEQCELRDIRSREILVETPSAVEYVQEYLDSKNTHIILIPAPEGTKLGHVDKHIYSGKISYISHENRVGVIIEDKYLYENEKAQFEALWALYKEKYGVANH